MYKKAEIEKALAVYNKVLSVRETIKILSYPDPRILRGWVKEFNTTGTVKEKKTVVVEKEGTQKKKRTLQLTMPQAMVAMLLALAESWGILPRHNLNSG